MARASTKRRNSTTREKFDRLQQQQRALYTQLQGRDRTTAASKSKIKEINSLQKRMDKLSTQAAYENPHISRKQLEQDAVGFLPGVGTVQVMGRYLPGQRAVNRLVRGRNPAEDIELLNDLAPETSIGHIAFTPEGLEEFVRDGFVYHAYSNTPVFSDGYRMGTPIETLEEVAQENPAKYERCVKAVEARGGANGYAVCTAQGLRNPDFTERFALVTEYRELESMLSTINAQESELPSYAYSKHDYLRNKAAEVQSRMAAIRVRLRALGQDWQASDLRSLQEIQGENPRKRRRRNPADEADALYESFHGAPPAETLEFVEQEHVHGHLAGLGDLISIVVKLTAGSKAGGSTTLTAPDPYKADEDKIVRVTSNETGTQLYLTGGDQRIDVESLGFRDSFDVKHDGETFEATELKDLMVLGEIQKLTYRTQKGFDNFEDIDYFHKLGEDTRERPLLLYDTMNEKMRIAGGEYHVHDVGVVN